MLGSFGRDLRFAVRRALATPGLSLIVVATFALGIGANTAIFSILDRLVFRSLPANDPSRLALLDPSDPNSGTSSSNKFSPQPMSHPLFIDLRDRIAAFEGVLAYEQVHLQAGVDGKVESLNGELVSGTYFPTLGLRPAAGRLFNESDDVTAGGHPIVVLGFGYWQSRFGGQTDVVGQTIQVNAAPMTVVGVAPPGFQGLEVGFSADVFLPVTMKAQASPVWPPLSDPRAHFLTVMARLKPGVTVERATTEANVVFGRIMADEEKTLTTKSADFRKRFLARKLTLLPGAGGASGWREEAARPMVILMIAAGVVLLVACLNIANLLLARATLRSKETAVRLAIGASASRLLREFFADAIVLAVAGAVVSLFVARALGTGLLSLMADAGLNRSLAFQVDSRILLFTLVATILAAVLAGLTPALHAARSDLFAAIRDGGGAGAFRGRRARAALVVGQVALSVALVAAAGLFARSLRNLATLDPGFRTERLATFTLDPSLAGYNDEKQRLLYADLKRSIAEGTGVASVSFAQRPLLADSNATGGITIPGRIDGDTPDRSSLLNVVGADFFATLGVPLRSGRDFDGRDRVDTPRVTIVNDAFVKRFFEGMDPLGQRFTSRDTEYEIVGVVPNFKHSTMRGPERPQAYMYVEQEPKLRGTTFYVRGRGDERTLFAALRATAERHAPGLPVDDLRTMRMQVSENLVLERFVAALASSYGILALFLAALGLYGVLSYTVGQRRREMGVRLAIGATRNDILRLILSHAGTLCGLGIILGIPLAIALGFGARTLLYGLSPVDPTTYAAAIVVLGFVALWAGYFPARRAARVDPVKALRYE